MNVMRLTGAFLFVALFCHRLPNAVAEENEQVAIAAQRTTLLALAKQAEQENRSVQVGTNGWLYFVPELRAISIGKFWGADAIQVSRATKPEYADPLVAIVDFHDQLQRAGIELLLVPVPAKVVVYPEPLLTDFPHVVNQSPARLDTEHHEFYRQLRKHGVEVMDLVPAFNAARAGSQQALYCQTDSHWSGQAVILAADLIADRIRQCPWLQDQSIEQFVTEERRITIQGDLAKLVDEANPASEELSITRCGRKHRDQIVAVAPSRSSPVLLMGDSHTLVFHDPTLFASGAGLPDHLARNLGFAVDLIGVRGSGSTTTRVELLRRKDNLDGKKLVVWCFSCRELTESETGWRKIPVIRP